VALPSISLVGAVMNEPHWEHGHRCHGYWLDMDRIGFIGIPPGRGAATKFGYGWEFGRPGHDSYVEGRTKTLKAAKRAVEKEYRKSLSSKKR
jgi:hypothetical protein